MKILKLLPKYLPWILLIVGGIAIFKYYDFMKDKNEKLETYNRQLKGNLTQVEQELQQAHHDKGILESKLVTQKELNKTLKNEKEELDADFENFRRKYDLEIKSRDKTIASLKQKITDGETKVVVVSEDDECKNITACIITYNWEDMLGRFKLKDPNIFNQGDEVFESNQIFKIYGEVYQQKNGSLMIRRLVLREVYQKPDGTYEPIENAKADIVDSDFKYHNPPTIDTEWKWTDLFRLRAVTLGSVTAFPDDVRLRFGLGLEFFNWEGLGINSHTAFDFNDIEKWEQRIGVTYSPNFFDNFKLNVGLGVSVGTPFANIFQDYSINIDLIFYLHE